MKNMLMSVTLASAVALLSFVQAYSQLGVMGIVVFQSIWTAFMYIVIKLKGLGL